MYIKQVIVSGSMCCYFWVSVIEWLYFFFHAWMCVCSKTMCIFCFTLFLQMYSLLYAWSGSRKAFGTSSRYLMHACQKQDGKLCNLFQDAAYTRVSDSCTIHTTMGDIQCKLFAKEWVPPDLRSILLYGVYQECVLLSADLFDLQFVWNVNQ